VSCPETRDRLHAYFDDELDAERRATFEEHLRLCPECTRELETQQTLRAGLREPSFRHTAPVGLEERIRSALRPAAPAARLRPRLPPALAAAAALLIGVGIGSVGTYYGAPRLAAVDPSRDVLDSHVRSLLGDNLIDIKSSDGHTVKPWLASRLDFSLPVQDFAEQGFPLRGGRLDFVDRHTAAVLVYDRGKHHINLFVWPSDDGDSEVRKVSRRGYTLLHWTRGGLSFWAASDVNADDLWAFVRLVQAE